jgi:hypothetical protein
MKPLGIALLVFSCGAGLMWLKDRARRRKADLEAVDRIIAGWAPKPRYNYRRKGRFAKRYGTFILETNIYNDTDRTNHDGR